MSEAAEVVLRAYPVAKAGKAALVSGVVVVVTAEVNWVVVEGAVVAVEVVVGSLLKIRRGSWGISGS